jgi:hypothetical protein
LGFLFRKIAGLKPGTTLRLWKSRRAFALRYTAETMIRELQQRATGVAAYALLVRG